MRKTEKAGSRNMGTQERRANQTGSHSVARKRAKCTKGSKGNSMQANKDEDFNKDESGRGAGKPWDFPGTASHLLTPTCRLAHTHVQKREGGSAGDGVVCWKALWAYNPKPRFTANSADRLKGPRGLDFLLE